MIVDDEDADHRAASANSSVARVPPEGRGGQLEDAAEAGGDAAAERQTEPAAGGVAVDVRETGAVVVDSSRHERGDRAAATWTCRAPAATAFAEQVAQDHAERLRRQRQRRGQVGGDLDLCAEILDDLVEALRDRDERPARPVRCRAASSSASTRSSASSTGLDGSSATSAAWSGVFSSCATSAAKSSSASLRRASWIVVRARRSSAARRLMIGAREVSADSNCGLETATVENEAHRQARAEGCGGHRVRSHRQRRARARRRRPWPTTRPSRRRSRGESVRPRRPCPTRGHRLSRAPEPCRARVSHAPSYSWRTGSSMTFCKR